MQSVIDNFDIYDEVVSGSLPDFFANFRLSEILFNPNWVAVLHDIIIGSIMSLAIFAPLILVFFLIKILFLRL